MVKPRLRLPVTASLLAVTALACAAPVSAQRVSLADRVALLEQRAAEADTARSTTNIELLNQLTELRTQLRQLHGQFETLQQQNEQLKASVRSLSLDLDDRVAALERALNPAPDNAEAEAEADIEADTPAPAAPAVAAPAPAPATPDAETASADAADPAPDPAQERAAYERAFDALKTRRYPEAARLFQAFLHDYPDGAYAANARYWLGESYYVVEDYTSAMTQFAAVVDHFPEHDKAPGALLKIGLSRYGLKQYDEAEATLQDVQQRWPGSETARIAADRLRAIQLSRLQ